VARAVDFPVVNGYDSNMNCRVSLPTELRYATVQNTWQVAWANLRQHSREMARKYGTHMWDCYALKGERDRHERLCRAESRASKRFLALLDTTPSGERWHEGVSLIYLCDRLPYAQATAERPVLPESALGYGTTRRNAWFEVA